MAAAEALAHGIPVLTTTGTPWSVLHERGCGWQTGPTPGEVAEGLRIATSQAAESLRCMGTAGRTLVAEQFSWERPAASLIERYDTLRRGACRRG
jgi:glycosyltransferase involved in cell wall biosynthesis